MLLQHMLDKHPGCMPSFIPTHTCYLTITGSRAYGVENENSDYDVVGFCVPPDVYVNPERNGFVRGFDDIPKFDQWENILESSNGNWDFKIYNIVKFFRLAKEGNPNILETLYTEEETLLFSNEVGQAVRDARDLFVSRECHPKFMGFASSHRKRLENKKGREELVKEFGFDTKDAGHLIRVLLQYKDLIETGEMDLKKNCDIVRKIREGKYSLKNVLETSFDIEDWIDANYKKLEALPDTDTLRSILLESLKFGDQYDQMVDMQEMRDCDDSYDEEQSGDVL